MSKINDDLIIGGFMAIQFLFVIQMFYKVFRTYENSIRKKIENEGKTFVRIKHVNSEKIGLKLDATNQKRLHDSTIPYYQIFFSRFHYRSAVYKSKLGEIKEGIFCVEIGFTGMVYSIDELGG